MAVVIVAGGTRGDVAPYTGLGNRLRAEGYDVAIATHESFADLVRGSGLEFRCIPGDLQVLLRSAAFDQWQGRHARRVVAVAREAAAMMRQVGAGIVDAVRNGTQILLLSNTVAPLSYHVAEELRIPSV